MARFQDLVLSDARPGGRVVSEFSQSASPPMTSVNWYPAGFCAGLTARWLAMRAKGDAWPADQSGKDAVSFSWKAVGGADERPEGRQHPRPAAPERG